ncbi:MFS transporter [Paeniglutamicibacter sp. NPDC012692]|uniref:MFS transporter n=1 Tax=Paeniglutamicibacter sp. NPDC012692 TaxID=3364388 RepID=UPI003690D08F
MKSRPAVPIIMLALGVFGIITTEMGIIGLLPLLSERYGTSAATTGWLVSIFALVVAITGPVTTLLASRLNRKSILLASIGLFAIANVAMALSSRFEVSLICRVIPALAHPVFFAIAITTAASMVPPAGAGRAVTKVFAGVTLGFAFGIPVSSFLAERFSVETAFIATAVVNAVAFIGLLIYLPAIPADSPISYGDQLRILRRPTLWLNIITVVFIFAAMFSGFSYFADYLGTVSGLPGTAVSALLLAFGVFMVFGNFVFGALRMKNLVRTMIAFPLLYIALYAVVALLGAYGFAMTGVVIVWGLVHSGGLILSQAWLGIDTQDAPEFGNSLFISFSNLGITLGAAVGGWFISVLGPQWLPLAGAVFAGLAAVFIAIRLAIFPAFAVDVVHQGPGTAPEMLPAGSQ